MFEAETAQINGNIVILVDPKIAKRRNMEPGKRVWVEYYESINYSDVFGTLKPKMTAEQFKELATK